MGERTWRDNPFTPGFGEVPLYFAGRDRIIRDLRRAFESTRRRPELTMSVQGARGTGKTALLTVAAQEAQERGWIAVNVMATDGMLEDVLVQARRNASHLVATPDGVRVAGIGVGDLLHVELERRVPDAGNWRSEMSDVLDALAEHGVGLLVTVDEVQPTLGELVQLASVYQLFVRENRKVALMMAGLPHNMSALLQDKSVSFLRRAQACRLGNIEDIEVERALRITFEREGRRIDDAALELAVEAAGGFPFMVQLVGYRIWEANAMSETVTEQDAHDGIREARRDMVERVIEATYRALSDGDRRFLAAMLPDDGDSRIGDIADRMGKSVAYATQYKLRLLEQGVIGERGRGKVAFELPLMREYVQSHPA